MEARRHWLTIGVTAGVILATGLAFAEPSETPDEWTFDKTKAFTAWPSLPTTLQAAPSGRAAGEGDATTVRGSGGAAQTGSSTGGAERTFQLEQGLRDR